MPPFAPGAHNLGLREDGFRKLLWDAYQAGGGWQRIRSTAWVDQPDARRKFLARLQHAATMMGLRVGYRMPDETFLDIRVTAAPDQEPSIRPEWPEGFPR